MNCPCVDQCQHGGSMKPAKSIKTHPPLPVVLEWTQWCFLLSLLARHSPCTYIWRGMLVNHLGCSNHFVFSFTEFLAIPCTYSTVETGVLQGDLGSPSSKRHMVVSSSAMPSKRKRHSWLSPIADTTRQSAGHQRGAEKY